MSTLDWEPIWLTLQLAVITTVILYVLAVPLAYWVAYEASPFTSLVQAVLNLPVVLPPSVLGFYLLLVLGPNAVVGRIAGYFDLSLVFSFWGILIGSLIFSLPFMFQPLLAGFEGLPRELRESAYSLGTSRVATVWRVLLPNMKSALLSAGVLCFAHTMGEFGVVLMLGGSIPGETKVASVAIFDAVERLDYDSAHRYAIILCGISFAATLISAFARRPRSLGALR